MTAPLDWPLWRRVVRGRLPTDPPSRHLPVNTRIHRAAEAAGVTAGVASAFRDRMALLALGAVDKLLLTEGATAWVERWLGPGCPWLEGCPLLGVMRAALDPFDRGSDRWRPVGGPFDDETGVLTVPVWGGAWPHWGPGGLRGPVDVLALDPRRPERWWSFNGLGEALGDPVPEPGDDDLRYGLFASPLAWLRAGCPARTGVAVDLDRWIMANGEHVEVVADDRAFATAYAARRRALLRPKRPPLPPVSVARVQGEGEGRRREG